MHKPLTHKKKKKKEIINFISRETSANYALKIHEGGRGRKQLLEVRILIFRGARTGRFIQWKSWRMSIDCRQAPNFIGFSRNFRLRSSLRECARHLRDFIQRPVDIFHADIFAVERWNMADRYSPLFSPRDEGCV